MKKTVKKKPGRPPGRKAPRRPVLSTRVPLAFYETLKQAAQFSTRTMSEELIWRTTQTFERDNILDEVRKTLAEAQHLKEEAIQAALDRRYTQIHSPAGAYWMPKGAKPLQFRP